jgi:tetratricopeptide (TPR) repeat protein
MERESGVYCERVLQDDVAVAYLKGELPEAERDAFERHFFECETCFERLRVVRDLRAALPREQIATVRPMTTRRPIVRAPLPGTLAWAAAAAFVAVGAAVLLRNTAPPSPLPSSAPVPPSPIAPASAAPSSAVPARPTLDELARVEPPPYAPLVVRGADPEERAFAQAMERYTGRDYPGAASGLRAALAQDPSSIEARFYLGISELMSAPARPEAAIRELQRVAAADDPAFAEAARYYLAKAHLGRGDVAAARRELQRVARGEGDHKEDAERLLQALGTEP